MDGNTERFKHRTIIIAYRIRNREQTFFIPRYPLTQRAIMLAMPRKDHVLTQVGVPMFTEFTIPTGDRRVNCHALTILRLACKLMSQHQRTFQLRIPDLAFGEPM